MPQMKTGTWVGERGGGEGSSPDPCPLKRIMAKGGRGGASLTCKAASGLGPPAIEVSMPQMGTGWRGEGRGSKTAPRSRVLTMGGWQERGEAGHSHLLGGVGLGPARYRGLHAADRAQLKAGEAAAAEDVAAPCAAIFRSLSV